MTISISTPTSNTGSIQNNSTDVLTIGSDNSVSIDTNTLHIDATNNRVGIGTSSPSVRLHVKDSAYSYLRLEGSVDHGGIVQFQGADDVINARIMSYSTTSGSAKNNLMFYTNTSTNSGIVERMRIDYNGNVGIGTSSPTADLHINRNGSDVGIRINCANTTGTAKLQFGTQSDVVSTAIQFDASNNSLQFRGFDNTERMRIDSGGKVFIGCTTDPSSSVAGWRLSNPTVVAPSVSTGSGTGATTAITFQNGNGVVGQIYTSGLSTSYVTSSDYRLKENVSPMSGSIDRLKRLKPSTWTWINGGNGEGFLAHEAQTVVPESVSGTKDAMRTEEYEVTPAVLDDDGNVVTEAVMGTREVPDYQGIDQSKLVPLLTAALQEAITKIEDLETRIQALESN